MVQWESGTGNLKEVVQWESGKVGPGFGRESGTGNLMGSGWESGTGNLKGSGAMGKWDRDFDWKEEFDCRGATGGTNWKFYGKYQTWNRERHNGKATYASL